MCWTSRLYQPGVLQIISSLDEISVEILTLWEKTVILGLIGPKRPTNWLTHSLFMDLRSLVITPQLLKLIAEIDEFKGEWRVLHNLNPDRLQSLRRVATIESIGSSTRIEGAQLTDEQIEALLGGVSTKSFVTRDEQEVAGYAEAMEMIFENYPHIQLTENYIKQLHLTVKLHPKVTHQLH